MNVRTAIEEGIRKTEYCGEALKMTEVREMGIDAATCI